MRTVAIDDDGIVIGVVTLPDGRNLADQLARAGFAWASKEFEDFDCNCGGIGRIQYDARITKRGLWVEKRPIAPWKYVLTYIKILEVVPQTETIRISNVEPGDKTERVLRNTTSVTSTQTQEQIISEEPVV